jgi:ribosomal protein L11 methyltransferase
VNLAPEHVVELCVAALGDLGCLGVEERDAPTPELLAWFDAGTSQAAIERALSAVGVTGARVEAPSSVRDPGWVEASQRWLKPVDVGSRFTILPGAGEPGPGRLALRVEPGRAFGTGHHESTRLALEWLEEIGCVGAAVLDVGTGSGILAAAAARLGAARALGTDIDEVAVEVAGRILESLPEAAVVTFEHANGFEGLPGGQDIVLANITSDVLLPRLESAVSLVAPGGWLVLSGLLQADEAPVEAGLRQLGLAARWRREGEWSSAAARRVGGAGSS